MKTLLTLSVMLTLTQASFAQSFAEDIAEFSEGKIFKTNIHTIEKLNIRKVMLPNDKRPWSGSYWADRSGSIAVRYTNSDFNERRKIVFGTNNSRRSFENHFDKMKEQLKDLDEEELGLLSPAEKYDLLVGDENFTFTRHLWEKIDDNQEHWGMVTMWTGICHGWAPASIHLPRPRKMIRLPIMNGTRMLPVYPDDIKAIGSFLWANKANNPEQMFSGNRCNKKSPDVDRETGLVNPITGFARSATECADVDALLFHLITVNRIGIMNKSFIADVDYNSSVNNHPVAGYELEFYNLNNKDTGSLRESIIARSEIKKDELYHLRHPKSTHVVGVEMKFIVTHWQNPVRKSTDSVGDDKYLDKTFFYELDLDASGEPLKGHWRIHRKGNSKLGAPNFPDFIWNDFEGFRPSEFFTNISSGLQVDLRKGIGSEWLPAAEKNSSAYLKLANITRLSHRLSKKEKLPSEASRLMSSQNISRAEAADQLQTYLTQAGVPEKEANPQPIAAVVLQLFELAK
jgi:hypothetical protein